MITGWADDRHDKLHRRALELQPAIALAAMNSDKEAVRLLYQEFLDAARKLRITEGAAWRVYAFASLNWVMLLIDERAEHDGTDPATAAQVTILATKDWVSARG